MSFAALWVWVMLAAIPVYLVAVVVADWRAMRRDRLGDPADPGFVRWLEEHRCR